MPSVSQVFAADMNDLQDGIIAANSPIVIPANTGQTDDLTKWKINSAGIWEDIASSGSVFVGIPRTHSGRVSAVRAYVIPFSGANVAEVKATLLKYTDATPTTVAGPTGNASGGDGTTRQTIALSFTAFTLAANQWLTLKLEHATPSGVGDRFLFIEVDP